MLTITLVFLGTTALHTVISEENTEIVKFLVDQGADIDIDKPDVHGWIPRALADYQGHEEIKALFQTKKETRKKPIALVPELQGVPYLKKYQSELTIAAFIPEVVTQTHADEVTWSDDNRTRRANIFHNSLFGIMSAANRPNRGEKGPFTSSHSFESPHRLGNNRARVTISCSGKGESTT